MATTTNRTSLYVIITLVALSAIAAYFFLFKKKNTSSGTLSSANAPTPEPQGELSSTIPPYYVPNSSKITSEPVALGTTKITTKSVPLTSVIKPKSPLKIASLPKDIGLGLK